MASVTRKRSVVTLERKLGVARMLEDGKSQQSVSSVYCIQSYGHFHTYGHLLVPRCPDY